MLQTTFRQFEVFVKTIDLGSFAKAAEEMKVSQPAISRHIKALEQQCGMPLLLRASGQKSELTPAGEMVYQRAQFFVAEAQSLTRELSALRGNRKQEPVRVSGHPFVIEHIVRPKLGEFLMQNPAVSLDFTGSVSEAFSKRNAMTGCDVAFGVSYGEDEPQGMEVIRPIRCGLFAAAAFRPKPDSVLPFVLPLESTPFEAVMMRQIRDAGVVDMEVVARAQHTYVIKDLVRRGVGVAFLPRELVAADLASGHMVQLPLSVPDLRLVLVIADQARNRKSVKAVVEFSRRSL